MQHVPATAKHVHEHGLANSHATHRVGERDPIFLAAASRWPVCEVPPMCARASSVPAINVSLSP